MRVLSYVSSICVLSCTLSAAVITSGSITAPYILSGPFVFNGAYFTLKGGVSSGGIRDLGRDHSPGDSISIFTQYQTFNVGSASVAGTDFPLLDYTSSGFIIDGPAIVLDHGGGSYSGTFSFVGSLCGSIIPGSIFVCAVSFPDLTGIGTVDVTVADFHITPQTVLIPTKVVYTFTVPEPANAMLMAPVIVLLALLQWKSTRGNFGAG